MGNICAADLYTQIKSKYKNEFTKFIVTENSIKSLDKMLETSKN